LLESAIRNGIAREHGDALTVKENVFGGGVTGGVGFRKDFASVVVPVQLVRYRWGESVGFGDAAAVAVIEIGGTSSDLELAFGVPPLLLLDDGNAWVYIRRGLAKDEQEP